MYPWQTGHLGCGLERVRARARAFARDKRPRETVKIEFAAKPRPAACPIGSAGGPPYRPIGTPGIDVSAKFRNTARERARGDGGSGAYRQRARMSVPCAQFRDGREATCAFVRFDCYSSAISVRRRFSDPDHPTSRSLPLSPAQLCPNDLTSKPYSVSTTILDDFTSIILVRYLCQVSKVFLSTFPFLDTYLYGYGKSFAENITVL